MLINNQSNEEKTSAYLKTLSPHSNIRILFYDKPFNYSAINNYAVSKSKAEYILLLNNDIEIISQDWLSSMLEYIQLSNVGVVGARLIYPQNNTLQHAGVVLGLGGVAGHAFKHFPADTEVAPILSTVVRNYSAVTGACLLTKKSLYQKIGCLDEKNLKVAFNDVDFCIKAREAGYYVVYTPHAELYHYESLSRGSDEPIDGVETEQHKRFVKEITYIKKVWDHILMNDPYYHPKLSKDTEDFRLDI